MEAVREDKVVETEKNTTYKNVAIIIRGIGNSIRPHAAEMTHLEYIAGPNLHN